MAKVSRNAPCPCGSGKKYKHCHMNMPIEVKSPRVILLLLLCVAAIAGGVLVGLQRHAGAGISVTAGGLILIGIFWFARRPPPPKQGKGDPGAINFGR